MTGTRLTGKRNRLKLLISEDNVMQFKPKSVNSIPLNVLLKKNKHVHSKMAIREEEEEEEEGRACLGT